MRKLREAMPDLEGRMALAQRVAQLNERTALLQRQLQQARGEIDRLTSAPAQTAESPSTATSPDTEPAIARPEVALVDRAVLCVGGRAASVPVYRRLVENRGGRFLHHDGGEENGANQLESTLAAADLVICQTGCVSHNAYWRVKDHCKRTGKRCVFVETPSAASLQRALAEMPGGA